MRLETFHNITKEQEILQQKRGHYKFEPQHITQDDKGNIYWIKWKDRDAIQVNEFRVWVSNDDGKRDSISQCQRPLHSKEGVGLLLPDCHQADI